MTTQCKPTVGGAFASVSLDASGCVRKSTAWGATLTPGQLAVAVHAAQEWRNCAGLGTAATRAQTRMAAIGLLLQEI